MLQVKTPAEALRIIKESFQGSISSAEILPLPASLGRILAENISASEFVPGFDRSSVDGYAVRAADTHGSPASVKLRGVVELGKAAELELSPGECAYVPTGGAVPDGADAIVRLEHTESYGGGEIGIMKSAIPGSNMIFRGEDVFPGKIVLRKGRRIRSEDIGALAAMGICNVRVSKKPVVGILSTGDELVAISEEPAVGQVRDVNSAMLAAAVTELGAEAKCYGIVRDGYVRLRSALSTALSECDIVLICGGSSVGQMDSTCAVLDERGTLLVRGIAIKPGKPTIIADIGGKPVFGLPGQPLAAHFVTEIFVKPLIEQFLGCRSLPRTVKARLTEAVPVSPGRVQYCGVILSEKDDFLRAKPLSGRSGLISSLADCDGYFAVAPDHAAYAEGEEIDVIL